MISERMVFVNKKDCKWVLLAYAAAWVSTGTAVTVAMCITRTISPLFFLLLPAFITISYKS